MGALSARQKELLNKFDPATREVNFTALLDEVLDRGWKQHGVAGHNVLDLPAVLADEETVTIGNEVYEVALLTTDSGEDTSGGEFNNTTEGITVLMASHGLVKGDLILVESEVMMVIGVLSAGKITLARGRCGTTAATHADANNILTVATPGAGLINVGVADTTAAAFATALAATINETSVRFAAADGTTHDIVWKKDEDDDRSAAAAETLGGAGNAWLLGATFLGTTIPAKTFRSDKGRVPTAAEVTQGNMYFAFPNMTDVSIDSVSVRPLATIGDKQTWKAHDGTTAVAGALVTITNDGVTDFAASDIVILSVRGSGSVS
jgi:hypothetical protein